MPRDAVCCNRGNGAWCADKRVCHPAKGCCEKGWTDCQNRCMPPGAECCGDGIACARDWACAKGAKGPKLPCVYKPGRGA
jgi:hypothetical protein